MIVEPFATKYRVSLAPTHLLLDPKEKIRKRFRALGGSEGLVEQGLELPAVDRVHLLVRIVVEFAQPLYGFVGDGGEEQEGNTAVGGFRHGRAHSED